MRGIAYTNQFVGDSSSIHNYIGDRASVMLGVKDGFQELQITQGVGLLVPCSMINLSPSYSS